jgi:spore coat polysaccharide biosynthesis protein SpsF
LKIVAIVQARLGSSRLPEKVLLDLAGKTVLERCVERLKQARTVTDVCVATTSLERDTAIERLSSSRGWAVYRGSEDDVLDRYYRAARSMAADVVVRITSDCPLIDAEVVDQVVELYLEQRPDYASNGLPRRTFPRGLDTEVFGMNVLDRIWQEDTNPAWREHVTPYIYRNPDAFVIAGMVNPVDYSHHRWTLDTPEDYELLRRIYERFGQRPFGWRDVLALVHEHPDWSLLNRDVEQKAVH